MSKLIAAYERYSKLCNKYGDALQDYKENWSLENRKKLHEAIQNLKRQQEIIDRNRGMLME